MLGPSFPCHLLRLPCFPWAKSTFLLRLCSYVLRERLLLHSISSFLSSGDTFDHQSIAVVTHGAGLLRAFSLQTLALILMAAPLSLIFKIFEPRKLPIDEARGEKKPAGLV